MGQWGIRPKDFWALHPWEFWQLTDAKRPRQTYAGGLSEAEVAELYAEMQSWGAFPNA